MPNAKSGFSARILQIAFPLILQQLCLQLQIWIDRAMLGHANPEFFSAVGNVLVPFQAVSSIITAICGGTTILVAHHIGARHTEDIKHIAEASFVGNSLLSAAAAVFFLLGAEGLFRLMGVQEPILGYSISYIRILAFSLIILGPLSTATSILQGLGLTKMIMLTGICSNLLNIVLDWILIYGRFGLPAMDIEGAALATVAANFLTAPMLIVYVFVSRKIPVRLNFPALTPGKLANYKQVLRIGIPSGLEYALWNLGNIIVVSFLNRLDMMAAGIYTLIFSIESFPLLIYMGFANAGLTLVGQKTGENDPRQAQKAGFTCLFFSLAVCLVIAVVFRRFPDAILALFTDDAGLIRTAAPYLIFVSWIMFPKAVNNVIGLCIRGTGDTRWMLYTQIFGTIFTVAAAYLLIFTFRLGLWGIFVTLLADESLRGLLNLIRFRRKL